MTEEQKTELIYLQDLVFESARWRISQDDEEGLSPIESEVRDRLQRLQAALTDEGPETLQESDYRDLEIAHLNEHLENWKIKINYNGRPLRLPRYMLEQVPCKSSHTGYSWKVKGEYVAEADAKVEQLDSSRIAEKPIDKLGDELWSEHEHS